MASCELGHVYVVETTLTRPNPKDKISVCVSVDESLFIWFNTDEARHGAGQVPCAAQEHSALSGACFLDVSRVVRFSAAELETARHRGPLSNAICHRALAALDAGVETLPPRHAEKIRAALSAVSGNAPAEARPAPCVGANVEP